MTETKNYVDKVAIYEELVKSFEQNKLTDAAQETFQLMTTLYANKLHFYHIHQNEYVRKIAMDQVNKHWQRYPIDSLKKPNNPFSYFTQVIKCGLAKGWLEWKKENSELVEQYQNERSKSSL